MNDFSWSVSGCIPNFGDSSDPNPTSTLWLTDPRPSPAVPGSPWQRQGAGTQGIACGKIQSILNQATTFASTAFNSTYNTSTALAIPYGSGDSANAYLTAIGNFGDFQGDVELTTLPTFTTDGLPSICDFYQLRPGSGLGTSLGYFVMSTNGALTFYAEYRAATISVSTVGSNASISFPSLPGGTYTLSYNTNASGLSAPVSTWATVSTNIVGDGTVKSFQQPIGGAAAFYNVSVH